MTSSISMREALAVARRLGCRMRILRRTGQGRLTHPHVNRTARFHSRQKDAPRTVTTFLRLVTERTDNPAR